MSEPLKIRGGSLFILAAIVIVAAGLKSSQALVVPFLLSAFIAIIAATPMFWLQKKGLHAGFALPVVMILIILMIVLLGAMVAQSTSAFSAKLPFYQSRLVIFQGEINTLMEPVARQLGIPNPLASVFSSFSPSTALAMAGTALSHIGAMLSNSFLILLTVIFILAEAASFPQKLAEVLRHPEKDLQYFSKFTENVNRYIAIKTTTSAATGLLVTIMLWALGVDFPILWGLLAFLFNYVPTIGSIIAAVPPVLLALIQISPATAVGVAAGFMIINVIMGNAIEPRFMGRGLGLSTLIVFLSLVLWGWVLGPVGMVLSVPLTMTAKIAFEANPNTQWIAHLLGPAQTQAETISSPPTQTGKDVM
ncbi:MAG: AI-2E family transporter [Gammaproteobacteria bacterium]|jgi:AI-2 transport protein TqsA|nr:AI-2E family transporter [Gammaproteobacteria bacterium]